jgi:CCGSCS motif protein
MKSEVVQLKTSLNEDAAMTVARILNSVKGVAKVAIGTASSRVDIAFDEEVTSIQEMRAILHQAGFEVNQPAHGEAGMCCGSCGG